MPAGNISPTRAVRSVFSRTRGDDGVSGGTAGSARVRRSVAESDGYATSDAKVERSWVSPGARILNVGTCGGMPVFPWMIKVYVPPCLPSYDTRQDSPIPRPRTL